VPWSEATPSPAIAPADLAACREALRRNSRTFHAASLLLPADVRASATVLYGFCRLADDAVDLDGGQSDAVQRLRRRLEAVYAQQPMDSAADRALAALVRQHAIPAALPGLLIEGLEWDAQNRRYDTLDQLFDYAARVAGTVGAMMALLMGATDAARLARAADLGVAMQLSNIARDVGEDAAMGRLYLPGQWLREAGVDAQAWLQQPVMDERIAHVRDRLVAAAEPLYRRAAAGVAALPWRCRPGIEAARLVYGDIGRQARRGGLTTLAQRAQVPGARRLARLAQAVCATPLPRTMTAALREPPLPANQPLVDAVPPMVRPTRVSAPQFVFELFDRLERLERRSMGARL
jgi:15-cis-phytoene synthase